MPIETVKFITRQMLRDQPEALFVFGDNIAGTGYGGQARECRGEPNSVGIPTKVAPWMFFRDEDLPKARGAIDAGFQRLARHLKAGGVVVLPADGVGTGLAQLPTRAPRIHDYITRCMERLKEVAAESVVG